MLYIIIKLKKWWYKVYRQISLMQLDNQNKLLFTVYNTKMPEVSFWQWVINQGLFYNLVIFVVPTNIV